MPDKALIIVPTYNERENIERLIERALAQDARLEVLVVDDGSPDGTGAVVKGLSEVNSRVHLLPRASKMGLGTAYLAGFRWALERDYELVLEMDADFSHDPIHLPHFLNAMRRTPIWSWDRATSREGHGGELADCTPVPGYCANIYARRITGLTLGTRPAASSAFGASSGGDRLDDVRSNGYAFQIEMSFRAWRKGFRLVELPIVFVDRSRGKSKMRWQDPARGVLDGVAPALVGNGRYPLRRHARTGRTFYKMSGSGNDFVMVDATAESADELVRPRK